MNIKKIIAALMSVVIIALTFAACSNNEPPVNEKELDTPPETITISGQSTEEVTAITGSLDDKGNVIDSEGIIDAEGHKVYYTGYNTDDGKKIYTTGKYDKSGNILYTTNNTDDRGNLIYYTGTVSGGKLELDKTNSVPDYSTNENSNLTTNTRYTSTSTVSYSAPKIEKKPQDIKKSFLNYTNTKGDDLFRKVIPAQDGGYIAAAFSMSRTGIYDGVSKSVKQFGSVIKFDEKGEIQWKYIAGGDNKIDFNDVTQLKDGSIVAVGFTLATDTDAPIQSFLNSALIVKLSEDGELMWSYSFPGDEKSNGEYLVSVCATPDGGFVAGGRADTTAGFFTGTQSDHFKAFLFKFDKRGNLDWRKILTGSRDNSIEAIDVNEKGDIFATCVTYSNDGSFSSLKGYSNKTANTVVLKFDKEGTLKWTQNLMGSGLSEFKAVEATADGGCLIGGKFAINKKADGSFSMGYGSSDGYIVKYNADGGVCWSRVIGGRDADDVRGIIETENGIVVVGRTKSAELDFAEFDNLGGYDSYIMIIDNAGKTISTNKIAGAGDDSINSVAATGSGIAVVGFTYSTDADFAANTSKKSATGFYAKYDFIIEEKK